MGNGESVETSPPGQPAPHTARLDVDMDQVERRCNTQQFDAEEFMVTRRGAEFPITVHSRSKLTVKVVKLTHKSTANTVMLALGTQSSNSSSTTVQVTIPVDAAIGTYELTAEGEYERGIAFEVKLSYRVVVLFNAWHRDDGVFLEDEDSRQEYVRNANGRLYAGSTVGIPWNLGLYRPNSIRAVVLLLEKLTPLSFEELRDPVLVAREMSALVNIQDDNGILVGNWSGNYSGGSAPTEWRGSAKILEEFYTSGGRPVRYGQCWVFSGVLLSVLRILGIPSRSITNFSSAHDTNRNRTIDEYYSSSGEKIDYLSSGGDSIWNFHVWNEGWMARPDLPKGFGGWQVLDATPQEESPQGGGYRTGPAPLKAIKDGNSVVYDANFVIAEVNADIKKYTVGEDGAPRLFKVDTRTVGRNISTKAVGSTRRHDVTNDYKYQEGSDWERRALYAGYEELLKETHEVVFSVPEVEYEFGQDINFTVQARKSKGAGPFKLKGTIKVDAVSYTGKVLKQIKTKKVNKNLTKQSELDTIDLTIEGAIFSEFPGTKVYLSFDVFLAVDGTSQIFSEKVNIAPNPPRLNITAPKRMEIGASAKVTVTFKNPLPVEMTDVLLLAESAELLQEDLVINVGTISGGAQISYSFEVVAIKLGMQELVVGLESDKVELVSAEAEIEVVPKGTPTPPTDEPDVVPQPHLIDVVSVDLNLDSNRSAHHTDRYEDKSLIVRRGHPFTVEIKVAQAMPSSAVVACRAAFTPDSRRHRADLFDVMTVCKVAGNQLTLEIKTEADVAVGAYRLVLTLDNQGLVTVVDTKINCIILFNPWSDQDQCYYPQTEELSEYVLNNSGNIWVGSSNSNYGRPWQFAQFKQDALEVALWAINKTTPGERDNPILVTRTVSAMVNVQDDNGILVGNWSGDYSGGTSPTAWTGSADILTQFNKAKKPVKYAQCWVFSGVQTTLLRALGLPARSITNFNSAHDTHFNRAIDKYFDVNGEEISSGDSIWNFHVWNESWLMRPDLPQGFGGWQVLDATPQEESPQGGGYRLGPCSQRAVRLGQRMNYDVEFVVSEVNADIRYYTVNADESLTLTRVNTTHVGKSISTKAVGSRARNDVTLEYKFAEGSTSERAALLGDTESQKQIGLVLSVDHNIEIGQDFIVRAIVTNKAGSTRTFKVNLYGRAMLYTGAQGQIVKRASDRLTLKKGESKELAMPVDAVDYLRILEGGNFIHFVAMALFDDSDYEEKLSVVETETLRLKTPDILVTLPSEGLKLHVPTTIAAEFKNPLAKRLTNATFHLHGEGYVQDVTAKIPNVGPHGTASVVMDTIPVRKGTFTLVVDFSSDQLKDIFGDEETMVV